MGAIAGMVMPLVTTGIQAGIGAIANGGGKNKKPEAKAPDGDAEAGKAAAAGAQAAGGANAQAPQDGSAEIDRFIQMLDNPNIRTLDDIKGFRNQVIQKMQEKGLDAAQAGDMTKKLNQAILRKLGIAEPGPNGSMLVTMNAQNQQILQALGMKPDQIQGGAAGPQGPAQQQ